ncbi:hypothetical protein JQC92_02060 [Shewanella sp. 202IG2-18]|uniref:hypothetical protein n=1 Tax=Parashewanella hymeniacidonis TaxID=2807618 RepID=UPI0019612413|nr:hypothetical protein [Parashewanella hymeniacidonis]MBM7070825.1 hypothetical protein [Parashewanella hymeniacidonis]
MKLAIAALLLSVSSLVVAAPHNGEVKGSGNKMQMWEQSSNGWVGVETFWNNFAKENGGLTWGDTKVWPEYDKLKERDLMLIEVKQGKCLMEFFHGRWRRAQDVQRWDDRVNEYGGCPYVFD